MGNFAPIFLAFVLNCIEVFIFRIPKQCGACFPFASYVIFITGIFCLLWDIPINPFPRGYRQVFSWIHFVVEFLMGKLILERMVTDFWVPLQIYVGGTLPSISNYVAKISPCDCSGFGELSNLLRWHGTQLSVNYALSIFFTSVLMHATRTVDFRLLRFGAECFLMDIRERSRNFFLKFIKQNCWRLMNKRAATARRAAARTKTRRAAARTKKTVHFAADSDTSSDSNTSTCTYYQWPDDDTYQEKRVRFEEPLNEQQDNSTSVHSSEMPDHSDHSYCNCDRSSNSYFL